MFEDFAIVSRAGSSVFADCGRFTLRYSIADEDGYNIELLPPETVREVDDALVIDLNRKRRFRNARQQIMRMYEMPEGCSRLYINDEAAAELVSACVDILSKTAEEPVSLTGFAYEPEILIHH